MIGRERARDPHLVVRSAALLIVIVPPSRLGSGAVTGRLCTIMWPCTSLSVCFVARPAALFVRKPGMLGKAGGGPCESAARESARTKRARGEDADKGCETFSARARAWVPQRARKYLLKQSD